MKGMIVVKAHRCTGCKSCEIACAVEHSNSKELQQAVNETPAPSSRIEVAAGGRFPVPLQCRQCEDAQCVAVCPKNALTRTDTESPVTLDRELCIKCKWCILACPFGAISFDDDAKTIIKCDQCFERLQRGELPACVSACPTGALEFEPLDGASAGKRAFLVEYECGAKGRK